MEFKLKSMLNRLAGCATSYITDYVFQHHHDLVAMKFLCFATKDNQVVPLSRTAPMQHGNFAMIGLEYGTDFQALYDMSFFHFVFLNLVSG